MNEVDQKAFLQKAHKILGEDLVSSTMKMKAEDLNNVIVQCQKNIETAREELKQNAKYQQIVEDKKLLESGLREVKKICGLRTQLAIIILQGL